MLECYQAYADYTDMMTLVEEPIAEAPLSSVAPASPEVPKAETAPALDLLPPPPPAADAHDERRPVLEFTPPPLRVVDGTPAKEPRDVPRSPEPGADQLRLLSATRTAVRDLRDAFMVTVSRPGETVTRSEPPEGVTGSIGGVPPLMGEQMTIVRVRNVVLVILALVALIVILAMPLFVYVDRRLNPPPAASAPANPD